MFRTRLWYKDRIVADEVGETEEDSILNARAVAEERGYETEGLEEETERLSYS